MNALNHPCWLGIALVFLLSTPPALAESEVLRFARLEAAGQVYENVVVRQVTPRSILIQHQGGLSSVRLEDLDPRWQAFFNYQPAQAEAYEERLEREQLAAQRRREAQRKAVQEQASGEGATNERWQAFLASLNTEPEIRPSVDFSREVRDYPAEDGEWIVKSQGRRPSCAVFAFTSALELEYARAHGSFRRFSESYLIWATRELLGLNLPEDPAYTFNLPDAVPDTETDNPTQDADAGFPLDAVVAAASQYGALPESQMAYRRGQEFEDIEKPEDELIEEAREGLRLRLLKIPGEGAQRVDNLIRAMNAGIPVMIGLEWPHFRGTPHGVIHRQTPREEYSHAVTLFGYRSERGSRSDLRFYLKNSWGRHWGTNGYGWVSYEFLEKNLHTAIALEVIP